MSSLLQAWGSGRVRGAKGAPGPPRESWSGPQFWIQAQSWALCIPVGIVSPLSDLCAFGASGASSAAGGGQGEAKGHPCRCQLALLRAQCPSGKRDLDLGICPLTWKDGHSEDYFPHIWNIWSRGESDGPRVGVTGSCSVEP